MNGRGILLGLVMGMSVVGATGMWSDRANPGAARAGVGEDRPVIVPISGAGIIEEDLDGPEEAALATPVGVDPDPGGEVDGRRVPRFLGTFQLGTEVRAIFRVEGLEKPWTGTAGERIEGTEFLLESFDPSSARIVPVRRK
jgi:hypothetical protein